MLLWTIKSKRKKSKDSFYIAFRYRVCDAWNMSETKVLLFVSMVFLCRNWIYAQIVFCQDARETVKKENINKH